MEQKPEWFHYQSSDEIIVEGTDSAFVNLIESYMLSLQMLDKAGAELDHCEEGSPRWDCAEFLEKSLSTQAVMLVTAITCYPCQSRADYQTKAKFFERWLGDGWELETHNLMGLINGFSPAILPAI